MRIRWLAGALAGVVVAVRRCLYCARTIRGRRAKEHVIPRWLASFLGIANKEVEPTHFAVNGEVLSQRRHSLDDLLEGSICSTCNNGWMADLEVAAIPLLKPLVTRAREVRDLSTEQRAVVARWALKTCLMLNSSANYRRIVPKAHYHHMHSSLEPLPSSVWVFAAQHSDPESELYWMQSQTWAPLLSYEDAVDEAVMQRLAKRSYKFLLHFRHLMLLVLHWPVPGWRPVIWKGVHVAYFPDRGPASFHEGGPERMVFPSDSWRDAQAAFFGPVGMAVGERDD